MNAIMIVVGAIMISEGAAVIFFKRGKSILKRVFGAIVLAFGIIGFLFGNSFKIVPTGYTGVKISTGRVRTETLSEGFNFKKPFVERVKLVSNKQQDKKFETQIWGETSEKIFICANDIVVSYRVSAEKSAWILANLSKTDDLVSQELVASSVKSAMSELSTEEVTIRSKIEPLVREKLSQAVDEKYGIGTVEIVKIVMDQINFEDSYSEIITNREIAKQIQATQEIENNTAIAKAEADKKIAIVNAEAMAEVSRIVTNAEAEAN